MVFRLYWKQAGDRQNMIIRQLNIKNSGEIHDKTLEFSPGINVLYIRILKICFSEISVKQSTIMQFLLRS